MKILFICNSLEEGRDGVGDQTRRLAIESANSGVTSVLVAFNDRHVEEIKTENINAEVTIHQLPAKMTLVQRTEVLKAIMEANQGTDWVSFQFVSYGLNKRGIVKAEVPVFAKLLQGFKVHVMFHELWVAEERGAKLKMKLLGLVQKQYIVSFLKRVKPLIINTSIPLYKKMLEIEGFTVSILPLFSNITRYNSTVESFKLQVPEAIFNNRDGYLIGCIFGTLYHDSWDMDSFLTKLIAGGKRYQKKVIVSSIGKIAYGKDFWDALRAKYPEIEFVTFGMQDERFISYWLTHFVDLGIVTTPAIITGKSSSMMAFIDHGIPVYCKKNELAFNFEVTDDLIDKRLVEVDENFQFDLLPRLQPTSLIKNTTQIFIKALNDIKQ